MATYSKVLLSGSTLGKPIKVGATSTPGTTIHATGVSGTIIDEVTLYAYNVDTVERTLTIEFGGATDPDDLIVKAYPIPAKSGRWIIVDAQPLVGTGAAASTVAAFASAANIITISGHVNRITP